MATEKKLPAQAENIQEAADVRPTPAVAPSESARPVQVLSASDSMVADLVKESPTLAQIESVKDLSVLVDNPLALPDECAKLQRVKYRYKWLNKDKNLPAKLNSQGWVLCNPSTAPYIKASRFKSHGAVEQAGMLLAFMPEELARKLEVIPAKISADRVKAQLEKGKSSPKDAPIGFYEPESGPDDEE